MTDLEPHDVPADVDSGDWRLVVTGAVADPLSLSPADLAALPTETYTADFACVEGWVAEDLAWRGVPVRVLFDRANPSPAATHVLVRAMDGEYACSFRLDDVRDAVLATGLDGDPLSVEHGGPARLVPTGDADCWESVKWVAELDLRASPPDAADTARDLALSRVE